MSIDTEKRLEKAEKLRGKTIRDFVKITEWKDVSRAIKYWYPGTTKSAMGRYEEIFEWLKTVPRRTPKDKKDFLQFELNDELFWAVNRKDIEKDDFRQYYHINSTKYSCSFRSWTSIANLEVHKKYRDTMTRADMIAMTLWEITFYGYDEDSIKKVGKDVLVSYKDAKKDIDKKKKLCLKQ